MREAGNVVPTDRFLLRMPVPLRERVNERAEELGISVNQFLVLAAAKAVGWDLMDDAPS